MFQCFLASFLFPLRASLSSLQSERAAMRLGSTETGYAHTTPEKQAIAIRVPPGTPQGSPFPGLLFFGEAKESKAPPAGHTALSNKQLPETKRHFTVSDTVPESPHSRADGIARLRPRILRPRNKACPE